MRTLIVACLLVNLILVLPSSGLLRRLIPNSKLSEAEWNTYFDREENGPGTYSFGYDIDDAKSGNTQFRQEERFPNGTVEGSYGVTEPDGNVRVVHYTADHLGYRARIQNSLRKNEDYPPRPAQQHPVPSWIFKNQVLPKVPAPEFVSNSVENTPSRVPLLSYYKGKFYPLYTSGQTYRKILENQIYSGRYPSFNNL